MHLELCAHIILGSLAVRGNSARLEAWLQVHDAKVELVTRQDEARLVQGIVPGSRTPRTEMEALHSGRKRSKIKTLSEKAHLLGAAAPADAGDDTDDTPSAWPTPTTMEKTTTRAKRKCRTRAHEPEKRIK